MDFWPNGGHTPMPGTEYSWHAGGMSHFRATVRANIIIIIKLFRLIILVIMLIYFYFKSILFAIQEYFIESISHPRGFRARKADSFEDYQVNDTFFFYIL